MPYRWSARKWGEAFVPLRVRAYPTESTHNVVAKRELFEIGWYPAATLRYLTGRRCESVDVTAGSYSCREHAALGLEDFGTFNWSVVVPASSCSLP